MVVVVKAVPLYCTCRVTCCPTPPTHPRPLPRRLPICNREVVIICALTLSLLLEIHAVLDDEKTCPFVNRILLFVQ